MGHVRLELASLLEELGKSLRPFWGHIFTRLKLRRLIRQVKDESVSLELVIPTLWSIVGPKLELDDSPPSEHVARTVSQVRFHLATPELRIYIE